MRLSVYRNLPVRYKQLFKFIKFYRLIHTIEGDVDAGYEIALDGPVSMFRHSQKYGLQNGGFPSRPYCCVPAGQCKPILSARTAAVSTSSSTTSRASCRTTRIRLYTTRCWRRRLPRALPRLKPNGSSKRESEVVNLKETVMIPDFTFRHPDGRMAILEIMGYWRPEYLRRKLEKLRQAQRKDLLVAVSSQSQCQRG